MKDIIIQLAIFLVIPTVCLLVILNCLNVIYCIHDVIFKVRNKSLKDDFKFKSDYYKRILKKYSPAVLSYVCEFDVDSKTTIPLILLDLELKSIVQLDDKTKRIIKLKKPYGLNFSEEYVYDQIVDGKIRNVCYESLEEFIKKDVLRYNLMTKDKKIENNYEYTRTKKGEILYSQIMDELTLLYLRYICCFSIEKLKEKKIWTDYLIYSIMFSQSKETKQYLKELNKYIDT